MTQRKYRFQYREFYDVPRVMLIGTDSVVVKLASAFDEESDDYEENYTASTTAEILSDYTAYWTPGGTEWSVIGYVPVREVKFDHTKRSYFVSPVLDALLPAE